METMQDVLDAVASAMSEVGPNLSDMQQLADFVQDLINMLLTEAELRAVVLYLASLTPWKHLWHASCCALK